MKVVLRNPRREVEVAGGRRVQDVLRELSILPETVLVIRGDELLTNDARLAEDDTIELRPVMSGGAALYDGSSPPAGAAGHSRVSRPGAAHSGPAGPSAGRRR